MTYQTPPPQYQKQKSFQHMLERIFKYIKVPTKAVWVTALELSDTYFLYKKLSFYKFLSYLCINQIVLDVFAPPIFRDSSMWNWLIQKAASLINEAAFLFSFEYKEYEEQADVSFYEVFEGFE